MSSPLKQCPDCLAWCSPDMFPHDCPPWMKMLVRMKREADANASMSTYKIFDPSQISDTLTQEKWDEGIKHLESGE